MSDEQPLKRCTLCLETFPATLEFFASHKRGKDGLSSRCRKCRALECKQWRENNAEHYLEYGRKHTQEFNAAHPEKKKARDRAYYEKNRERLKQKSRVYYRQNIDYERQYRYDYYRRNMATMKQRAHLHYQDNKERHHRLSREWNRNHPNQSRAIKHRARVLRISRIAASDRHFTAKDIERQYKAQKGRCYWCGKKLGKSYHVDHIVPIARGGSNAPENIVIACPPCNLSKNDSLPHEWSDKLL